MVIFEAIFGTFHFCVICTTHKMMPIMRHTSFYFKFTLKVKIFSGIFLKNKICSVPMGNWSKWPLKKKTNDLWPFWGDNLQLGRDDRLVIRTEMILFLQNDKLC